MTEEEWLKSDDPTLMLRFLAGKPGGRKLRLVAVACCQRIRQSPVVRQDLEDAEFYLSALEREADGVITLDEWSAVVRRILDKKRQIYDRTLDLLEADFCAFLWAVAEGPSEAALWASVNANIALSKFPRRPEPEEVAGSPESLVQVRLLRDIFGNPFRPITLDPSWLTSTVTTLARQMYESRDFSAMPILADALQDAGCEDDQVLSHCRGEGVHVRGCFLIDLILKKSEVAAGRAIPT